MKKLVCAAFCLLGFTSAFAEAKKELNVGLVLSSGGKDDRSFNQSAYEGAEKAEKELGVKFRFAAAQADGEYEGLIERFARRGDTDLIIAVGFIQADAVKVMAEKYPKINFAIVDSVVEKPNVRSITFAEHEGSFLVGAVAGLKSQTGKVGFVGGMDIPLIHRFYEGYKAGALHVNPKAEVIERYIGVSPSAWNDPVRARSIAGTMYGTMGADIVFHAAGGSGQGVFDAAKSEKKFAIGVDSNQNYMMPGTILTSMLKRVDVGVYKTIEDFKNGKFTAGQQEYNVANNGVGFSIDEHNDKLITADIRKKLEEITKGIVDGTIKVPDYYVMQKEGK